MCLLLFGRYFASKLWQGQTYYMQIDAHSLFQQGWDAAFVADIKRCEDAQCTAREWLERCDGGKSVNSRIFLGPAVPDGSSLGK